MPKKRIQRKRGIRRTKPHGKRIRRVQGKQLVNWTTKWNAGNAFPEELRTTLHCYVGATQASTNATIQSFSFLANSFGDGKTGNNGVGPQFNFAGQFAQTYPSGLKTLLSTPVVTGTQGPYAVYRIHRSAIQWRLVPKNIAFNTVNSPELNISCLVSDNPSYAGGAYATFAENPGTTNYTLQNPIQQALNTANTGAIPLGNSIATWRDSWHTKKCNVAKIFGLPRSDIDNNGTFWGTYQASPGNLCYFHILVGGDGTNYYSFDLFINKIC